MRLSKRAVDEIALRDVRSLQPLGQSAPLRGGAGAARERVPQDRGAFFHSLHGTLNHLLVADRIWMRRFTGTGAQPRSLDEILYDDLAALSSARIDEDERIIGYVDSLTESDLDGLFSYRTIVSPQDITQRRGPALAHFFNHQTHHRGQAHALVTQSAGNGAMPSLDMILFQRETGIGLA